MSLISPMNPCGIPSAAVPIPFQFIRHVIQPMHPMPSLLPFHPPSHRRVNPVHGMFGRSWEDQAKRRAIAFLGRWLHVAGPFAGHSLTSGHSKQAIGLGNEASAASACFGPDQRQSF